MSGHSVSRNSRKATSTMTFRIEDSLAKALRSESESKHVSLNTLVNQIFKRYVEWDMYETKVGMIPMAKPIVAVLFQNMTPQDVISMATKTGKTAIRDMALFMKKKMDVDSFLSWFETRMWMSNIELSHEVDNGVHSYIMKHELGYNWSLYHKTTLELIFNEILGRRIDILISDYTLSFKFEE